jgi:hypothetical protein
VAVFPETRLMGERPHIMDVHPRSGIGEDARDCRLPVVSACAENVYANATVS